MHLIRSLFGIVFSVFESIFETITDFAVSAAPSKRDKEYNADFESPEKLFRKSGSDTGFYVGAWANNIIESHSHMIVIGGSGSHKSTTICFNTILQSKGFSYVIHDCSRELYNGMATALSEKGIEPMLFDCSNVNGECFNALAKCKTLEDITKTVEVILKNSLEGPADYWSQSAETLVTFFCKAIWLYADPEMKTLSNVLHTINVFSYDPVQIDKWLAKNASSQVMSEYKSILSTPEKTLQSSLSTAKVALSIYSMPNIKKLTSIDTINFDDFRKRRIALFLCNSPGNAYFYRSITATLIQSFFNHILEKMPTKSDFPIMFMIDESSILKLPTLSSFLALSRKFRISVGTLWQDLQQIQQLYGKNEASNIFSNSNLKIFMPSSKPIETCNMLEKLCGKYQYIDQDGITRVRELLTAQQIYQLEKILVLNGRHKPILLDVLPFYKQPKLKRMTELPIYSIKSKLPSDDPPVIQFE